MAVKQMVANDLFQSLKSFNILVASKRSADIFVPADDWVIKVMWKSYGSDDGERDIVSMYEDEDNEIVVESEEERYSLCFDLDEVISFRLFKETEVLL